MKFPSRSLLPVRVLVLVVDAAQGIEAQTLANVYLALIMIWKFFQLIRLDLPAADPPSVRTEIEDVIIQTLVKRYWLQPKLVSVMKKLSKLRKVPAPTGDVVSTIKSLIFDSVYDAYRGVILQVRVDGVVKPGDKIQLMSTGKP